MAYPGNPSIAAETQKRILTTFSQTLDLARQGRIQEAALGCDFVLKMDPLFEPAGELQMRLQGASGPVEVDDLGIKEGSVSEAGTPSAAPVPDASPASTVVIGADDPLMQELRRAEQSTPAAPEPAAAEPGDVFELDIDAATPSPESLLQEGPSSESSAAPSSEPLQPAPLDAPPLGDPLGSSYSPEAAGRIQELLEEGHRHLEAGDHQAAIDAWSRIFLIDIDHDQANQLIESARQKKAEQERAIEEQYHEGLDALERGDLPVAREKLEAVLLLSPSHVGATEHLEQLGRRERGEAEPAAATSAAAESAEVASPSDTEGELPQLADLYVEESTSAAAAGSTQLGGAASSKKAGFTFSRPFALIAAGVLGLVLVAGWFLLTNWSTLFPNADETATVPRRPRVDRLQEANRLYLAGDIEGAIASAGRIPAISDDHQEAQQLIARWEEELEQVPPSEPATDATDEEIETQRLELLEVARRAYGNREFYRAARNFQAASRLGELDSSATDLFADARAQLRPIEQQLRLFRDGEYQRTLAPLWRLRVEDPQNVDVRNLLVDSYFNLAVKALRAGDASSAAEHLSEAAELDPGDPVVARVNLFADAYAVDTSRDLLYDIFVRALDFRTLADRG